MNFCKRLSCASTIIMIFCVIPSILMYFVVFQGRIGWHDAIETECTVVSDKIIEETCYSYCPCQNFLTYIVDYNNTCISECMFNIDNFVNMSCYLACSKMIIPQSCSCSYLCYDGNITVIYFVGSKMYQKDFSVYVNMKDYNELNESLQVNYPIGRQLECCYDKNNPTNVELQFYNPTTLIIIATFLLIIGLILFCIYLSYEKIKLESELKPQLDLDL